MDEPEPARVVTRYRPHLAVRTVPGEATYLVGEHTAFAVRGPLVAEVTPYLSGKHTEDEIVTALADRHPPELVYHALSRLRANGYVMELDTHIDPLAAGLWETGGYPGDRAVTELATLSCEVHAVGDVDTAPVRDALALAGIAREGGRTHLRIVLTDDYLNPDLAEFDRQARASGQPWLLARPCGPSIWVGPVFEPGTTGCWHCLAFRLRRNRMVESYLADSTGRWPIPMPIASPSTLALAGHLVTLRASRWAVDTHVPAHITSVGPNPAPAGGPAAGRDAGPGQGSGAGHGGDHGAGHPPAGHGHVEEHRPLSAEVATHPPVRRSQCPECGDPGQQAARGTRPIQIASSVPVRATEGGYRARPAAELLPELESLISPITGVISTLEMFDPGATRLPADLVHACVAGHNFALGAIGLDMLREGLRSQAAGKGTTAEQARLGAAAEAIERYSGLFHGDEARITASFRELGEQAIHPNAVALFSEQQYRDRARWNTGFNSFARVGMPLDETFPMEWSPVQSLTGGPARYLPTMQLYYFYPRHSDRVYAWANSNGCASGSCPEDAMLQGLLELAERDAVAMWWYHRLSRPAVDLDSFDDEFVARCRSGYRQVDRDLWVLDLTNDLGIPVFAAVSRRTDKPVEDLLMAFGAHLDPRIAMRRAVSELNQFLPAVVDVTADGDGYRFPDPVQHEWWQNARLADHRHLAPNPDAEPVQMDSFGFRPSMDIAQDLRTVVDIYTKAGLEVFALDQTRPDLGLPVFKTIVPGLRHFWARFAPGRLYDVPVKLGWLDRPTPEADLNPVAMFL